MKQKLTKEEIKQKHELLIKDWGNFWRKSQGGENITEEIEEQYPLQVAGYLRESIELGGSSGYADTSYLRRNEIKSKKMFSIKSKYNLDMNDINIMFYGNNESYLADFN